MSSLMKRNQSLEKSKRYWALGVGGAGVLSLLVGSKFLGLILLGSGVYLGWQWLKFRINNGMRF